MAIKMFSTSIIDNLKYIFAFTMKSDIIFTSINRLIDKGLLSDSCGHFPERGGKLICNIMNIFKGEVEISKYAYFY